MIKLPRKNPQTEFDEFCAEIRTMLRFLSEAWAGDRRVKIDERQYLIVDMRKEPRQPDGRASYSFNLGTKREPGPDGFIQVSHSGSDRFDIQIDDGAYLIYLTRLPDGELKMAALPEPNS